MLNKQPLSINFAKGLDTKTDPFQVAAGKFLSLQNTIFTETGLLRKRNGYGSLAALPDTSYSYATTFNGSLTAIGNKLAAYSKGSNSWVAKGAIQPLGLKTLPLIRSNTNQSTCDAAVSPAGLVCTAYTDQDPTNLANKIYRYAVADSVTGQNIIAPTTLTATGAPKVFLLGSQFIVVYPNGTALNFVAVSTNTLTATSPVSISTTYTANAPFDAVSVNGSLYVAWYYSTTPAIKVGYIDSTLSVHTAVAFSGYSASTISVTADTSTSTPVIWVSFFNGGTSLGYALAVGPTLGTVLAPGAGTQIVSSGQVVNITSSAKNNILTFFYQNLNTYSFDSALRSDFILKNTITVTGTVGTASTVLRSVGLASKSFYVGNTIYFLCAYGSNYQPTYFLSDAAGNLCLKLAYQNGGGYLGAALPNVSVSGSTAYFPYLYKDLITSVNKDRLAPASAAIYSQTGINLASVTLGASGLNTAEIAGNLHLSGGFLWMYDGYTPGEQNFHLYPDDFEVSGVSASGGLSPQVYSYQITYEWSDNQGNIFRSAPSIPLQFTIKTAPASFTGNLTSGSASVASVSSTANLQVGQPISGTGIPANTYITAIGAGTITMSANATATNTGVTIVPNSLSSLNVNVPTLRLTYKINNPVKIVIYRWSTAQETFYQATSISSPVLNDPTADSVTFTDSLADSAILGNAILYTTGGVVENIGPPATLAAALFKSRLFLIDAEDANLLWFSKQVVQGAPVEMSDLLTIYVAPTTGAQGSTGGMAAISAMDDKLIIFKKDAVYYLTGIGPDNTGANSDFSDPIFVTSTVGCANQNSIAFIPDGLMFQSDKGIWLLGRDLSTKYIGAPVEAYNGATVLSAITVPGTNQVRFTMDSGVTLVYDYFFGEWATFVNIPSLSSTLFQGLHTFINKFGSVFQETPGKYLDGSSPVLISFLTSWFNLAGLQGYQRAYMFYLLGTYLSPHKLTVQVAYDYNPSPSQTSIISPDNFNGSYGSDALYGAASPYGGNGILEQWRVDLQKQTCQALQISVSETFDSFFGTTAGAGLTLSGLTLMLGLKKAYRPIKAANTVG